MSKQVSPIPEGLDSVIPHIEDVPEDQMAERQEKWFAEMASSSEKCGSGD